MPDGVRTKVTKMFTFDAAHHLPNHDGKCRRPHGHTYKVEVSFVGEPQLAEDTRGRSGNPKEGFVVDFGGITAFWKAQIEPRLDHRELNESIGHELTGPTSAENIAAWIFNEFEGWTVSPDFLLQSHAVLLSVRVWETPTGYAEVWA